MIDRLRTMPAGRRAKWAVLLVWLAVAGGLGQYQAKLQNAATNDPASFLPASSDSTRVLHLLRDRFTNGRTTPALLVWSRGGAPLTPADRRAAVAAVAAIRRLRLPQTLPPSPPSFTRDTGVATVALTADNIDRIQPVVERIRAAVGRDRPPGLAAYVTGPAGITVDAVKVFGQIDVTLLAATSVLVLVLLLLIYRSPVVALVPLAVVAVSYAIAAGVVYLLIDSAGLVVNGQTTGILIILMFGAGTDYCLLIVSRYREELRRHDDRHEAMAVALRHTSPAILSSGATVVAAMLVLLLADLRTFRSAGPVLALGVATTMLAGLTLLPAVLTIIGRRAFWPFVPRTASLPAGSAGIWHRIAALVARRPLAVLGATVAALALAAVGNAVNLPGLSLGSGFRSSVESVQGLNALARSLPAGEVAPTDVVAPAALAPRTAAALRQVAGVASVRRLGASDDTQLVHLQVTLQADPYSDQAIRLVPRLRAAAAGALVGGPTAEEADTRTTTRHDERLIMPLTLLTILAILCTLLRAFVAPLYLVASVVLSFAATMGLSYAAFAALFDAPGSDASLPLFVFLFVVALGVDYNIFLMTRVREEGRRVGARAGVLQGLERTGSVITSAGIILAGTFAVLMLLPLEQLFQLGFAVALGVLIDTFIVRTLLVPAAAYLAGRTSWWPSRLA